MKFIKGKWYKNTGNFAGSDKIFAKFSKWENDTWFYSEKINNGVYEKANNTWHFHGDVYEPIDIKKIEHHLPENHPDLLIHYEIY